MAYDDDDEYDDEVDGFQLNKHIDSDDMKSAKTDPNKGYNKASQDTFQKAKVNKKPVLSDVSDSSKKANGFMKTQQRYNHDDDDDDSDEDKFLKPTTTNAAAGKSGLRSP